MRVPMKLKLKPEPFASDDGVPRRHTGVAHIYSEGDFREHHIPLATNATRHTPAERVARCRRRRPFPVTGKAACAAAPSSYHQEPVSARTSAARPTAVGVGEGEFDAGPVCTIRRAACSLGKDSTAVMLAAVVALCRA